MSGFDGYKTLAPEALVEANPDVLLLLDGGLESLGGLEELRRNPMFAALRAVRSGHVVTMPDHLMLWFGPRLGAAVEALIRHLHPERRAVLPTS